MDIKAIESYLYNSTSTTVEIISFLNFLYTDKENQDKLSVEFFDAFKKAYKKENILTILNRKIEEVANDREEIDNKDVEITDITEIIGLTKIENFQKLIYKVIIDGTEAIKKDHESYLGKLKPSEPITSEPIKYIIIGEAPPFSFIKNLDKSELKLIFENNYILSKKNAGIWQSSIRAAFGIAIEEKDNTTPVKFIEGLVDNNILFFDIIPVTLPFSTDIRKGWISKEIHNKPLLISLLDLAIEKNTANLSIDPNVKVAFVTPPKTSISIFDYYSDKKLKITDEISVDITIINDNTTKKKYNVGKEIILPMYKANAMMGANAPSFELLKLALDL
jgi:hypothetical protein